MTAYRKDFDETKYVSFLTKDDKLLEKYNDIWEKVTVIKKEFDGNPVYIENYMKAKIKLYNGKMNTNFHNNKLLKEGSQFIFLSVTSVDSIFRTGKNYYPQVFLEECKYVIKERKIHNYITNDFEISSDSDEDNSGEEILEKNQIKKILMRKILVKKILVKKILMKKIKCYQ